MKQMRSKSLVVEASNYNDDTLTRHKGVVVIRSLWLCKLQKSPNVAWTQDGGWWMVDDGWFAVEVRKSRLTGLDHDPRPRCRQLH